MNTEQRERSGDGLGTEIKEWRRIWNRERERKEWRWSGKSKKGVDLETNWEMRDERERREDGLETVRKEWRCTGNRERRD